jgi:phosphopentomutase
MAKRVFLIVLDSLGVGELPDAKNFGDEGSNTLKAIRQDGCFKADNLKNLGL